MCSFSTSQPETVRKILRLIPGSLVRTDHGNTNKTYYFVEHVAKTAYLTDTIPPTATIVSHQSYMNAPKISIDVMFSEACPGNGGFKCINSSHCDVSRFLARQFTCQHPLYGSYRMVHFKFYCFNEVQFSFVGCCKWSCLCKSIFTAYC